MSLKIGKHVLLFCSFDKYLLNTYHVSHERLSLKHKMVKQNRQNVNYGILYPKKCSEEHNAKIVWES